MKYNIKEYNIYPSIYYSFKFNINLINVIPNENISHFSGLNYPIYYYYPISYLINSGAI